MQEMQRSQQPEAIEIAEIKGAIAGVVSAVEADADLVRELARPDTSHRIATGQVVQTPSIEVPESHLIGQELAAGPGNSEPTTHEGPSADDETVAFKINSRNATLEYGDGREPLILGGEGANPPWTSASSTKTRGFTIATTAPGESFNRAA